MNLNSDERFNFTVQGLIEVLKTFPPELPVLVSGYESGYENFYMPHVEKMVYQPENMYFEGEFQVAENKDAEAFEAVLLTRVLRDD